MKPIYILVLAMLILILLIFRHALVYLCSIDELVPPIHMKRLFEASLKSNLRDFYSVLGGSHNDTWSKAGRPYYSVSVTLYNILCNTAYSYAHNLIAKFYLYNYLDSVTILFNCTYY